MLFLFAGWGSLALCTKPFLKPADQGTALICTEFTSLGESDGSQTPADIVLGFAKAGSLPLRLKQAIYHSASRQTVYNSTSGQAFYHSASGQAVYHSASGQTVYHPASGQTVYHLA